MILHPASQQLIEQLNQDLPQSLLVSGPDGIGFAAVVTILKSNRQLILLQPEKDDVVDLEKGSITIEMIRDLYELLRTQHQSSRLIVIRDADRMGIPAQNAFLKLLEEPGQGISFVLLSHAPQLLLPTIRSRTQQIKIRPISRQASESLLNDLNVNDATTRAQLMFIAEGLPALLTTLAQDTTRFEQRAQIVRDARSLLTDTTYQRLRIVEKYKDRREESLVLLTDAAKLLKRTPEMISKVENILGVYERIAQNGNIRLQLATLAV